MQVQNSLLQLHYPQENLFHKFCFISHLISTQYLDSLSFFLPVLELLNLVPVILIIVFPLASFFPPLFPPPVSVITVCCQTSPTNIIPHQLLTFLVNYYYWILICNLNAIIRMKYWLMNYIQQHSASITCMIVQKGYNASCNKHET